MVCPFTAKAALVPEDIGAFVITSNEASTLGVRYVESSRPGEILKYQVSDYTGAVIKSGTVVVDDQGKAKIEMQLLAGFYELTFPSEKTAFGILSAPGTAPADGFFCMDGILSWFAQIPLREPLFRNLQRFGIQLVRERVFWAEINPAKNQWDWETHYRYGTLRARYGEKRVLETFHDVPAWIGRGQGDRFPGNMVETSASWTQIAERWRAHWAGVEAWNEPDIFFGGDQPAEQYTTVAKTLRYALNQGGSTPMGGGAFAFLNRPYMELSAWNGLIDASDFITFHYYGPPLELENHIAGFRGWLKAFGRESKPLWITEIGSAWKGDGEPRPKKNLEPHEIDRIWTGAPDRRPFYAEDAPVACDFAMNATEGKACGIERYFPFMYLRQHERGKNFGMLDIQGTPVRSMAAYAQSARILADAAYAGDLKPEDIPGVKRIRVFEKKNSADAVVVAYTGQINPYAQILPPFPVREAYGVDGRLLPVSSEGKTPIPDGLVYLMVEKSTLKDRLVTDTLAGRLSAASRQPAPLVAKASPIVLQAEVDVKEFPVCNRGYYLAEGTSRFAFSVRVNNLSPEEKTLSVKTGSVTKDSPMGGNSPAGYFRSIPSAPPAAQVVVAPNSSVSVALEADVAELTGGIDDNKLLMVLGESAEGENPAPLVLSLLPSRQLDDVLAAFPYRSRLPIETLGNWEKNTSGEMEFRRVGDTGWGFDVTFRKGNVWGKGDRWVYPRLALPGEVDRDKIEGVVVRARCLHPATVRLMSWNDRGEHRFTKMSPVLPADGKWHVVYLPLDSYLEKSEDGQPLGRQIRQISLGLNIMPPSSLLENSLEVSDFYLVGGR